MSVLKTYGTDTSFHPSKTYRIADGRIQGYTDGLEAVQQAAILALSIERFQYLIYSNDYGSELYTLIGEPRGAARAELKRMIEETLQQDDRIDGIENFTATFEGDGVAVRFRVKSLFGKFEMERSFGLGGKL